MATSDSSMPNDTSDRTNTVEKLTSLKEALSDLITTLREPATQVELNATLHDPEALPHREVGSIAAQVVDILDDAKQMLQPSQLVLADHFMGLFLSLSFTTSLLISLGSGYYLSSKSLVAAVSFKIPDILGQRPGLTISQLAESAGAREDRLRPVMRLLYNNGLFVYDAASDTYTNNSRSNLLKSDHWTQWHTWVELYATEFYDMARGIPDSLRTDSTRTAAQINYDTDDDIFTYFQKRGWLPRVHRAFNASQIAQAAGILADYPWHDVADCVILDIGGGGGALLASLLREYPTMRGGILDLPAVIDHTRPFFHSDDGQFSDVGDRVLAEDLVAGDFLAGPIPRYEVYVMKWCLHNWLDPDVKIILQNIRDAIVVQEKSRLVVLDAVLQDGAMGRLAQYGDVQMLMTAKGRERTEKEWRQLAETSGWKVQSIYTLRNAWLQEVFKDSDKHSKAPANNSGFYMNQLLGQCLGLISGPDWRAVRGAMEAPFQRNHVASQVENFQRLVQQHFADLHAQGESNLANGLLHPVNDLAMLPFRIIAEMFYGRLPPEVVKLLEDLVPLRTHIFNDHVIRGGLYRFSWARFFPTAANADLARFKSSWKKFNQMALAYALQERGPPPPIVAMYDAVAMGNMNEDQLLQTLDESLFANLDVTIGGLSWVPVFLAAHQHDQERLRTEIDAACSHEKDARAFARYLSEGRSTFLACCTLESSRLRPLAAFTVPQAAPTSRRIDIAPGKAYVIPAGTSFIVDTYALNVRNEAWAPDNEHFRPDRFLNNTYKDTRARRYLFWRFGFGPRQCLGRYAADLMIRMIVAHLARNYHLDLLPSEKGADNNNWSRSQESWITHPDLTLRCVQRTRIHNL
ncbi:O-methyltransferase aclM [Colletotrichum gloeosporioides]|uniref:O-methyltransferase aclM n=1 Tax=Colletotrichum gloeosporioides TaxID=474922 RepID=A0A8H4FD97_COLGL|nr:O-methyltransferase aclM [Colletotrichum gloeosporioides]KAF3797720.1 O-methyltransferase aclM [Colletotrichum gloeosporioides]